MRRKRKEKRRTGKLRHREPRTEEAKKSKIRRRGKRADPMPRTARILFLLLLPTCMFVSVSQQIRNRFIRSRQRLGITGDRTPLSHPFSFLLTNKQKEQNNVLFELQIRDKSNLNRHLIKDLRIVTVYGVHFSTRRYEMNP